MNTLTLIAIVGFVLLVGFFFFGYYVGVKSVIREYQVEASDEPPEFLGGGTDPPDTLALSPEEIDEVDDWEAFDKREETDDRDRTDR